MRKGFSSPLSPPPHSFLLRKEPLPPFWGVRAGLLGFSLGGLLGYVLTYPLLLWRYSLYPEEAFSRRSAPLLSLSWQSFLEEAWAIFLNNLLIFLVVLLGGRFYPRITALALGLMGFRVGTLVPPYGDFFLNVVPYTFVALVVGFGEFVSYGLALEARAGWRWGGLVALLFWALLETYLIYRVL